MLKAEKERSNNFEHDYKPSFGTQSVRNPPKPQSDFIGSSEPQEEEKIKIKNPNPGDGLTL